MLMKKIVTSVGLVALGVSGAYAAYAPGLSPMDSSKAWSVSATLRGFYDDNYANLPSHKRDSFGFEVSPSIRFNLPLEQSYLGLRYIYSGRYYEDRDNLKGSDAWDHSHQVDLIFNHAFDNRYSFSLLDSFVVAQEPELFAPTVGGGAYPFRVDGDNLRNRLNVAFTAELTRNLSTVISYDNVWYDYEERGGDAAFASLSGLLDRVEHGISADLRWQALPETVGILGYRFGIVDYTSSEVVGNLWGEDLKAKIRDNYSHSIYAGVEHNFLRNLTGSLRAGATFLDFRNDRYNDDTWIPYVDANLAYSYAAGSRVQIGFMHTFNQTDLVAPNTVKGTITSAQKSSTVYGRLSHRFTPKLLGSVQGSYRHSTFEGGRYDDNTEEYFLAGVNLTYLINRHLSAEVGYNFDKLDSDASRDWRRLGDYDRNRVYIGVTATY
ncbi:MAG: hypothetical protein BWX84_01946 [Verrucomicrobia bacterium ADurb.Bin118]|nr:MAG: hypothetical protein BWX84_01946 [Verrucomicrobia bacterium ADurb.Bin118]